MQDDIFIHKENFVKHVNSSRLAPRLIDKQAYESLLASVSNASSSWLPKDGAHPAPLYASIETNNVDAVLRSFMCAYNH